MWPRTTDRPEQIKKKNRREVTSLYLLPSIIDVDKIVLSIISLSEDLLLK